MNVRKEHCPCYGCVEPKRHEGCHSAECKDWVEFQAKIPEYEENMRRSDNIEVDRYYRNKQYKSERGIRAKRWKIRGKL